MTLIISAITSSGIVLTADSRQSYKNRAGAIRIGSDSASKLFKLTDYVGVSVSGKAFLSEDDQPPKDISYFINNFKQTENIKELSVKDVANKLNKYLGDIFIEKESVLLKKLIEQRVIKIGGTDLAFSPLDGPLVPYTYVNKEGKKISDQGIIDTINMIVAGIDKDKIGRAYSVWIPKGITLEKDTQGCGALWCGQNDVVSRIIKGFAPEIEQLNFVKEALLKDQNLVINQLNQMEYIVNWGTMTIQDAVDFCVLMTRTTESIQRFSDGTRLQPGGIPGVGGEVDIAIITSGKGFCWLKKKKLVAEGEELCLGED